MRSVFCSLITKVMLVTSVYGANLFDDTVFNEEFNPIDLGYNTGGRHVWFLLDSLGVKVRPSLVSSGDGVLTLSTSMDGRYGVNTSIATSPQFRQDGTAKLPLFRYGYFETRMRFDPNEDNWPAFWLLGEKQLLHAAGRIPDRVDDVACEIDIMEGVKKTDAYGGTVHDWKWGPNPHNISNDNNLIYVPAGTDFRGWNTFGLNWTADQISWYLNGRIMSSWPTPPVCKTANLFIVIGAQKFGGVRSQTLDVQWIRVRPPKDDAESQFSQRAKQ